MMIIAIIVIIIIIIIVIIIIIIIIAIILILVIITKIIIRRTNERSDFLAGVCISKRSPKRTNITLGANSKTSLKQYGQMPLINLHMIEITHCLNLALTGNQFKSLILYEKLWTFHQIEDKSEYICFA